MSILFSRFILYMFSDSFSSSSFYLRKAFIVSIFSPRCKSRFSFLYILPFFSLYNNDNVFIIISHYYYHHFSLFFLPHSSFHSFLLFFFITLTSFLTFHLSFFFFSFSFLFLSSLCNKYLSCNARHHHHRR